MSVAPTRSSAWTLPLPTALAVAIALCGCAETTSAARPDQRPVEPAAQHPAARADGGSAEPHGSLREAAKRYQGAPCTMPPEIAGSVNGVADPKACGPFPCAHVGCLVQPCQGDQDCAAGFCRDGYCIAEGPRGSRSCQPFRDPRQPSESAAVTPSQTARAYYATRQGCTCTPDGARRRDRLICGSFPCSPTGCYVSPCQRDDDCAHGMCGSHASWPHGYCVTDDPH